MDGVWYDRVHPSTTILSPRFTCFTLLIPSPFPNHLICFSPSPPPLSPSVWGREYGTIYRSGLRWEIINSLIFFIFRLLPNSTCLIVVACYAIMYLFGSIMVFLFGIALPLALVLVHASMRLRNTKSKITTKLEKIGFVRTPMGLLLEALGQEQEVGS